MTTGIIIPARLASTRLPNKPLLDICGKPMIQRVYERAVESGFPVCVAGCDEELEKAVKAFGGRYAATRRDHKSGTDRIAEAAQHMDCDVIINLQGDEPLIDPANIRLLSEAMEDRTCQMATLCVPVSAGEAADPNLVKVVFDKSGYALYFSRSPIPYMRDGEAEYFGHIGIYGYRRDFLLEYPRMPRTLLECAESLEQLRALENGFRIKVIPVSEKPVGVDTMDDYKRVCALFGSNV